MYYFTVNYSTIYYSTTTPAVCISETDLRRFTVHLLFYYFTILPFYHFTIPVLYKAVCISETDLRRFTVHLLFYYFTILLFYYYSSTVLFYYVLFYR